MQAATVQHGDERADLILAAGYARPTFNRSRREASRFFPSVSPPLDPLCLSAPLALLLIILDDLRRANFRLVRIKPDVAKGASLAQEVPALIQLDPDLRQPLPISFGMRPELVQSVLFFDQALNVIEDRLIFDLILHENLLQRGCSRYEYSLIVRPHHPAVNRRSGPSPILAETSSFNAKAATAPHSRPSRLRSSGFLIRLP